MTDRTCEVDGCDGRFLARGLCGKHYMRIVKSGGELPPTEIPSAIETHRTVVTDAVGRLGNCAACGDGVPLLKSTSGTLKCATYMRARRKALHSRPEIKAYHRDYNRARRYGFANAAAMLAAIESVGSQCEICERPLTRRTARFDHDHACCPSDADVTCGRCVRGILCNACNSALGLLQDDPALMRKAAAYVSQELMLIWNEDIA